MMKRLCCALGVARLGLALPGWSMFCYSLGSDMQFPGTTDCTRCKRLQAKWSRASEVFGEESATMKFASVLRNSAEELPDLADLFALCKWPAWCSLVDVRPLFPP